MASPNLAIVHVTSGQNNKEVTMNAGLDAIDNALNSVGEHTDTTTFTLSSAEFRSAVLFHLTGSAGADFTMNVPASINRIFAVQNDTGYVVTVQVTGGAGASQVISNGGGAMLYSDGADVLSLVSSIGNIELNNLSDVDIGTPGAGQDGYVLFYDDSSGLVELGAIDLGLGDLNNVDLTGLGSGDDGKFLMYDHSGTEFVMGVPTQIYDVAFSHVGASAEDDVIGRYMIPRNVDLPADFAGSVGTIVTNPASSLVLDIQDDGVTIGTISISSGGVFTFETVSNTAKSIASGSILTAVVTTEDASAEDFSFTLAGVLA